MENTKSRGWELPEWLKWVLLPLSIPLIIVTAILLILGVLFSLLVGKRAWAASLIDAAFAGFDSP